MKIKMFVVSRSDVRANGEEPRELEGSVQGQHGLRHLRQHRLAHLRTKGRVFITIY